MLKVFINVTEFHADFLNKEKGKCPREKRLVKLIFIERVNEAAGLSMRLSSSSMHFIDYISVMPFAQMLPELACINYDYNNNNSASFVRPFNHE